MSEANAGTKTQSDPNTRVACDTLLSEVERLKGMLQGADTDYSVEIGSILWFLGDAIGSVLDGIKKDLRAEASTQLGGGTGTASFDGTDLGTASVNVPKASLRVPKGKDLDAIKSAIGGDFTLFFEEVTTYKPRAEFDERVTNLTNPLHQQILLNSIERVEPTPRVSFRRNTPPKAAPASTPAPAVSGTDPASLLDD
jgi:hypothetical protein